MSDRLLSDDHLLAACRMDLYRGSGPGGQKRNKTSNAVRLTHLSSGLAVTATESRSLALNKLHALRRLRIKLAAELREPVESPPFFPPDWFLTLRHNRRIDVSHRHPLHAAAGALVLDILQTQRGNPSAVAINLAVSTGTVIRLLEEVPAFWAAANRIRKEEGLEPLSRH